MKSQSLPSFWSILWISLVLCTVGWGGLILLVFISLPTLAPRWLFFFLITLALSGTALPAAYYLNKRFPATPPVESSVVLREAMWVGVYGALLAWLQMGRVLTSGLSLVLAVGLVLVEFLLRLGERTQWAPGKPNRGSAAAVAAANAPGSEPINEPEPAEDEEEEDD